MVNIICFHVIVTILTAKIKTKVVNLDILNLNITGKNINDFCK